MPVTARGIVCAGPTRDWADRRGGHTVTVRRCANTGLPAPCLFITIGDAVNFGLVTMEEGPSLAPFDPKEDVWEEWLERFEFYLDSNVTDSGKKKSFLLSQCGKETYSVLRSLVLPGKVIDKSCTEIVELLNGHLKRTTSVIVVRYRFDTCCREEGQSIAAFAKL